MEGVFVSNINDVQDNYEDVDVNVGPSPCSCWSNAEFVFVFALQRKELGVLLYNCSCLALDLHRVFSLYWGLQYKDFIPSFWSKRLFALFNKNTPLELSLNSTKAQAYISVSLCHCL